MNYLLCELKKNGTMYCTLFDTKEQAIAAGKKELTRMCKFDKKQLEEYYVLETEQEFFADGNIVYDLLTADIVIDLEWVATLKTVSYSSPVETGIFTDIQIFDPECVDELRTNMLLIAEEIADTYRENDINLDEFYVEIEAENNEFKFSAVCLKYL